GALRDPDAHDPRLAGRRTDTALRHDRRRERRHARAGHLPPRVEKRADPRHYRARAAVRIAAHRRDHHRADFFLAGTGPPAADIDLDARLSASAGLDP